MEFCHSPHIPQFYGQSKGEAVHWDQEKGKKFGAYWVDGGRVVGAFLEGGQPGEQGASVPRAALGSRALADAPPMFAQRRMRPSPRRSSPRPRWKARQAWKSRAWALPKIWPRLRSTPECKTPAPSIHLPLSVVPRVLSLQGMLSMHVFTPHAPPWSPCSGVGRRRRGRGSDGSEGLHGRPGQLFHAGLGHQVGFFLDGIHVGGTGQLATQGQDLDAGQECDAAPVLDGPQRLHGGLERERGAGSDFAKKTNYMAL